MSGSRRNEGPLERKDHNEGLLEHKKHQISAENENQEEHQLSDLIRQKDHKTILSLAKNNKITTEELKKNIEKHNIEICGCYDCSDRPSSGCRGGRKIENSWKGAQFSFLVNYKMFDVIELLINNDQITADLISQSLSYRIDHYKNTQEGNVDNIEILEWSSQYKLIYLMMKKNIIPLEKLNELTGSMLVLGEASLAQDQDFLSIAKNKITTETLNKHITKHGNRECDCYRCRRDLAEEEKSRKISWTGSGSQFAVLVNNNMFDFIEFLVNNDLVTADLIAQPLIKETRHHRHDYSVHDYSVDRDILDNIKELIDHSQYKLIYLMMKKNIIVPEKLKWHTEWIFVLNEAALVKDQDFFYLHLDDVIESIKTSIEYNRIKDSKDSPLKFAFQTVQSFHQSYCLPMMEDLRDFEFKLIQKHHEEKNISQMVDKRIEEKLQNAGIEPRNFEKIKIILHKKSSHLNESRKNEYKEFIKKTIDYFCEAYEDSFDHAKRSVPDACFRQLRKQLNRFLLHTPLAPIVDESYKITMHKAFKKAARDSFVFPPEEEFDQAMYNLAARFSLEKKSASSLLPFFGPSKQVAEDMLHPSAGIVAIASPRKK
jgi:hypothetical protein